MRRASSVAAAVLVAALLAPLLPPSLPSGAGGGGWRVLVFPVYADVRLTNVSRSDKAYSLVYLQLVGPARVVVDLDLDGEPSGGDEWLNVTEQGPVLVRIGYSGGLVEPDLPVPRGVAPLRIFVDAPAFGTLIVRQGREGDELAGYGAPPPGRVLVAPPVPGRIVLATPGPYTATVTVSWANGSVATIAVAPGGVGEVRSPGDGPVVIRSDLPVAGALVHMPGGSETYMTELVPLDNGSFLLPATGPGVPWDASPVAGELTVYLAYPNGTVRTAAPGGRVEGSVAYILAGRGGRAAGMAALYGLQGWARILGGFQLWYASVAYAGEGSSSYEAMPLLQLAPNATGMALLEVLPGAGAGVEGRWLALPAGAWIGEPAPRGYFGTLHVVAQPGSTPLIRVYRNMLGGLYLAPYATPIPGDRLISALQALPGQPEWPPAGPPGLEVRVEATQLLGGRINLTLHARLEGAGEAGVAVIGFERFAHASAPAGGIFNVTLTVTNETYRSYRGILVIAYSGERGVIAGYGLPEPSPPGGGAGNETAPPEGGGAETPPPGGGEPGASTTPPGVPPLLRLLEAAGLHEGSLLNYTVEAEARGASGSLEARGWMLLALRPAEPLPGDTWGHGAVLAGVAYGGLNSTVALLAAPLLNVSDLTYLLFYWVAGEGSDSSVIYTSSLEPRAAFLAGPLRCPVLNGSLANATYSGGFQAPGAGGTVRVDYSCTYRSGVLQRLDIMLASGNGTARMSFYLPGQAQAPSDESHKAGAPAGAGGGGGETYTLPGGGEEGGSGGLPVAALAAALAAVLVVAWRLRWARR